MALHPKKRHPRSSSVSLAWAGLHIACLLLFVNCSAAPPTSSTGGNFQTPVIAPYKPAAASKSSEVSNQEADMVIQKGTWLYTLHPYKGFTILDLRDPKNPQMSAALHLRAYPIEMFVGDEVAFLFVKQAHTWTQRGQEIAFQTETLPSHLLTVDIRDPKQPKLLQTIPISGSLSRSGLTRKRGDFLYAVTSTLMTPATAPHEVLTLHTFDVKDPFHVRLLQSFVLPRDLPAPLLLAQDSILAVRAMPTDPIQAGKVYLAFGPNQQSLGYVLTMIDDKLILTKNLLADTTMTILHERILTRVRGCSSPETSRMDQPVSFQANLNFSHITIFDLGEKTGQAKVSESFLLQGATTDQFKQSLGGMEGIKGGAFYSIVRQNRLVLTETAVQSEVKNILLSVDLRKSGEPRVMQELPFGKPLETVRASYYDHAREVLYAITATGGDAPLPGETQVEFERRRREEVQRTDPLYAISLASPEKMAIQSEIDGLSGDVNLFRPIEKGLFLIAVGRDTSAGCTGFGTDTGFSRTAVSIVDVRDHKKIKLVQRRCISINPTVAITGSQLNWDRDQAHKMIGLFEDGAESLVSIPVSYSEQTPSEIRLRSAVGLVRWDISQYKEGLHEKAQNVLSDTIVIEHDARDVQRTLILAPVPGSKLLINISESLYAFHDLGIVSKPQAIAAWPMMISVEEIWKVGDILVEQIASFDDQTSAEPSGELRRKDRALRFRRILENVPPEQWPVVSNLQTPTLAGATMIGKDLVLFLSKDAPLDPFSMNNVIQIVSLEEPETPKITHTLPWTRGLPSFPRFRKGADASKSPFFQTFEGGFVFVASIQDGKERKFALFSLTQGAQGGKPTLQELTQGPENPASKAPSLRIFPVDAKRFVLYRQPNNFEAFVQLWSSEGQQWAGGEATKIPGALVHVFPRSHEVLYVTAPLHTALLPDSSLVAELELRRYHQGLGWLSIDALNLSAAPPLLGSIVGEGSTLIVPSSSKISIFSLSETFSLLEDKAGQAKVLLQTPSHRFFEMPLMMSLAILERLSSGEDRPLHVLSSFVWSPQQTLPQTAAQSLWPIRSVESLGDDLLVAGGTFGLRRISLQQSSLPRLP